MINEKTLIDKGYKKFTTPASTNPNYVASYQKRFVDDDGVKYFVNFTEHDMKGVLPKVALSNYTFSSDVQFQTDESESKIFDVNLFVNCENMSIADVECFYEKMWVAMSCGYYEYK